MRKAKKKIVDGLRKFIHWCKQKSKPEVNLWNLVGRIAAIASILSIGSLLIGGTIYYNRFVEVNNAIARIDTVLNNRTDTIYKIEKNNLTHIVIDSLKGKLIEYYYIINEDSITIRKLHERLDSALTKLNDGQVELSGLQNTKEEQNKTIEEFKKTVNAFYWYKDTIALTSKQENKKTIYCFINRSGVEIDTLKEWDEAEPFNVRYIGYAKVKKGDVEYYMNTDGKTEKYSTNLEYGVIALDLSGRKDLSDLNNFEWSEKQLAEKIKILDLHDMGLEAFSSTDIFSELEYLDMSYNKFTQLPDFSKLGKLEYLDISGNNIKNLVSSHL